MEKVFICIPPNDSEVCRHVKVTQVQRGELSVGIEGHIVSLVDDDDEDYLFIGRSYVGCLGWFILPYSGENDAIIASAVNGCLRWGGYTEDHG